MKNWITSGKTVTVASAGRTASSGAGLLTGNLFGIISDDVVSGAACEIVTEGVFDLAKDSSTFAQGDKVYWDNTAFAATSTSSGNKLIGVAIADAVVASTVRARLNPVSAP